MATTDLVPNGDISLGTWNNAGNSVVASDDNNFANGDAGDIAKYDITDAPSDFRKQTNVQIKVRAKLSATSSREKTITLRLLNSSDTILESFSVAEPTLTTTEAEFSSTNFSRSDSEATIDGYRLEMEVTEGNGMADAVTVDVDKFWVTLTYDSSSVSALSDAALGTGLNDLDSFFVGPFEV